MKIDVTLDPTIGDRDDSPNSDPLELALMAQFKNHVVYNTLDEVSCWHHSGNSEWVAQIPKKMYEWLRLWYEGLETISSISGTLYFTENITRSQAGNFGCQSV